MVLFRDRGRGGEDLVVDGSVERHPGFSWQPEGYNIAGRHRRAQMKRCILCNKNITDAAFKKACTARVQLFVPAMKSNSSFIKWLEQHLPEFDFSLHNSALPLSVCQKHIKDLMYGGPAATSLTAMIESAKSRLTVSSAAVAAARNCDGKRCWICKNRTFAPLHVHVGDASETDHKSCEAPQRSYRLSDGTRRPASSERSNIEDVSFRRAPWKHSDSRLERHRASTPNPALSTVHVVTLGHAMGTSTRKAVAGARHLDAIGVVRAPSSSLIRRDSTRRNKLFSNFFQTTEIGALLSPNDGALHSCHRLVALVRCLIWVRNKTPADVALFRFSADQGQGDLKVSFQIVFSDDALFSASTRDERRAGDQEFLDTSVKRTFIIALINGASETYETLSAMFDSLDLAGVKTLLPLAEFVFPVDMKMANIVLGLGPVGCAYPYPYTLWSPFKKRSKPLVMRTVATITRDNDGRVAAAAHNERKETASELSQRFHSVYNLPMAFVKLFATGFLSDFIGPAPLHISLGVVKDLYDGVVIFSPEIAERWLQVLGIRHDERHGRSGFVGNDCRKLAGSGAVLERLLPRSSRKSHAADRNIEAIVSALKRLDALITAIMSVSLGERWAEIIRKFGEVYADVAKLLSVAKPYQPHRSEERLTPKMKCLLEEVPLWIDRHNCSLLRISEQSFESLHHDYIEFAAYFHIPLTGAALALSDRRTKKPAALPMPMDSVHTPSDGTRAGGSHERKRKRNVTAHATPINVPARSKRSKIITLTRVSEGESPSPVTQLDAPQIIGNVVAARQQRLRCLLAFNLRKLPSDMSCQARVSAILDWVERGCHDAPPWTASPQVVTSLQIARVKPENVFLGP